MPVKSIPVIAILGAVFLWGLTPVAIRYLVAYVSPSDLLVLRFALSGLLFLPLLWRLKLEQWSRRDILLVAACSVAGVGGYNIPVTYGAQWVPAGTTGLLIATEPAWIVVIYTLVLREWPRWPLVLGLVLAGAGVAMLVGTESIIASTDTPYVVGAGLILIGAFMWAVYCVLIPRVAHAHGAIPSAAVVQTLGAVPLLAFWDAGLVARAAELHLEAWAAIAFLALCASAMSVVLWNYGLAHVNSARAGVFLYLIPLITLVSGALLLEEQIGARHLLGGLLIVGGVAVAQISRASTVSDLETRDEFDGRRARTGK